MTTWVKIRRWTWELPQTLIGALLALCNRKTLLRVLDYEGQKVYLYDKFDGGISLGYYTHLDWNAKDYNNGVVREGLKTAVRHEVKGHGTQSKWLGPFYLLVIGLPSVIHCGIHLLCKRKWDYYSFYTERWADEIAGIKR